MPLKSVFTVDVDDAAFRDFLQLYEKYSASLKNMPGAWTSTNKVVGSAKNQFSEMAAALMAQTHQMRQIVNDADKLDKSLSRSNSGMGRLARSTKDVAGHILAATTSLLKWSSITGVISGLLGAGGLFGIERLALSAGSQRRTAQGLGTSIGGQQAFEATFGRLINPHNFLSGVNQALTDVSRRYTLYGAGLNESDLKGRTTGQVAIELLPRIKQLVDSVPRSMISQVLQARGLDQFISTEDALRLRQTSTADLNHYIQQYRQRRATLNIPDQEAKRWQDLNVQLEVAGRQIRNSLIDGLTGLAQPIAHVSQGFADLATTFLKNPDTKKWINDFGDSLAHFAKYVGTPQFKQDVDTFAHDVGIMAHKIASALRWLGLIPDGDDQAASGAAATPETKAAEHNKMVARHLVLGATTGALVGGRIAGLPGAAVGGLIGAGVATAGDDPSAKQPGETTGHWLHRTLLNSMPGLRRDYYAPHTSAHPAAYAPIPPRIPASHEEQHSALRRVGRIVGDAIMPSAHAAPMPGFRTAAHYGFLKRQEGLVLHPYNDVGHKAIGYGHDITANEQRLGYIMTGAGRVPISGQITKAQADAIFQRDVKLRENLIERKAPGFMQMNSNQREAILDYYYNTGRLPRHFAQNLGLHDYHAISESLRHGIHTVHGRNFAPLVRRRGEEADLFERTVAQRAVPSYHSHAAPIRVADASGAVVGQGPSGATVNLHIHNNTGGSATVSANQVAQ